MLESREAVRFLFKSSFYPVQCIIITITFYDHEFDYIINFSVFAFYVLIRE